MFKMNSITENLDKVKGKKVLLRLDLNVPVSLDKMSGVLRIEDGFRINQVLPTIELLRKAGAKIIIISHIESDVTDSLEVVFELRSICTIVDFGTRAIFQTFTRK